jgi:DNA-binding transcriptional MerR regulator
MEADIPNKLVFKIGEVATLTSLRSSVLRFWETEFSCLKPRKTSTGQRIYSKEDLEVIFTIKNLLYNEKLTIEGARKKIATTKGKPNLQSETPEISREELVSTLVEVREELKSILELL